MRLEEASEFYFLVGNKWKPKFPVSVWLSHFSPEKQNFHSGSASQSQSSQTKRQIQASLQRGMSNGNSSCLQKKTSFWCRLIKSFYFEISIATKILHNNVNIKKMSKYAATDLNTVKNITTKKCADTLNKFMFFCEKKAGYFLRSKSAERKYTNNQNQN